MNALAKPLFSIEAFENGTLDVDAFDHEAHIYIAWLHLEKYSLVDATTRYADALKRLTAQLGIPGKYHETITWFFMLLINERRQRKAVADWYAFRRNNEDLFAKGDDSILSRYYTKSTLGSAAARESFVLPDRLVS